MLNKPALRQRLSDFVGSFSSQVLRGQAGRYRVSMVVPLAAVWLVLHSHNRVAAHRLDEKVAAAKVALEAAPCRGELEIAAPGGFFDYETRTVARIACAPGGNAVTLTDAFRASLRRDPELAATASRMMAEMAQPGGPAGLGQRAGSVGVYVRQSAPSPKPAV